MDKYQIHTTEKPFVIVEQNETFRIAIGNTIVSEEIFAKLEDAKKYVKKKPYELIINTTCFLIEQTLKQKNNETESNN